MHTKYERITPKPHKVMIIFCFFLQENFHVLKSESEGLSGRSSGLQTGEKLPSFTAIGLRGDLRGKELDPVAKDGDHLHVLIFGQDTRRFGRFLAPFAAHLNFN